MERQRTESEGATAGRELEGNSCSTAEEAGSTSLALELSLNRKPVEIKSGETTWRRIRNMRCGMIGVGLVLWLRQLRLVALQGGLRDTRSLEHSDR